MVQFSQTSWQEYTLANMLETMRYAPLNLTIGSTPIVHYTLPKVLEAGEVVTYNVVAGFKKISWTGVVSSVKENKIMVRLNQGPFRGFTASHEFIAEGSLCACYDEMSFQGFSDALPENVFAQLMAKAGIVYGVVSRKAAREIIDAIEAKKQTQSFEALNQAATAG